ASTTCWRASPWPNAPCRALRCARPARATTRLSWPRSNSRVGAAFGLFGPHEEQTWNDPLRARRQRLPRRHAARGRDAHDDDRQQNDDRHDHEGEPRQDHGEVDDDREAEAREEARQEAREEDHDLHRRAAEGGREGDAAVANLRSARGYVRARSAIQRSIRNASTSSGTE